MIDVERLRRAHHICTRVRREVALVPASIDSATNTRRLPLMRTRRANVAPIRVPRGKQHSVACYNASHRRSDRACSAVRMRSCGCVSVCVRVCV